MARKRGDTGADVLRKNRRLNRLLLQGAEKAAKAHLEMVGMQSDILVPKDTRELLESKFINVTRQGNDINGTIGYSSDYSLIVHEMPETNNFTTAGTGPKYLEKPFFAMLYKFKDSLKKYIKLT